MKIYFWYALCFLFGYFVADYAFSAEVCSKHLETREVVETKAVVDIPPEYLKDAIITVTLANGTEHNFTANEYKVVKRLKEIEVTKTVEVETNTCHVEYKNRVAVLAGHGPKDALDKQVSPGQVDVSTTQGGILGLQYQRSLSERLSLGLQVQSNKTNSLMLGLDF